MPANITEFFSFFVLLFFNHIVPYKVVKPLTPKDVTVCGKARRNRNMIERKRERERRIKH